MLEQIESGSVWKQVYQDLGIPILNSAAGYNVKCAYRKYADAAPTLAFIFRALQHVFPSRYLYGFEEYCTSTAITFRMDLPLKQGAKGEVKPEGDAGVAATSSSCGEQAAPPGAGSSKAPYVLCKVPLLFMGC